MTVGVPQWVGFLTLASLVATAMPLLSLLLPRIRRRRPEEIDEEMMRYSERPKMTLGTAVMSLGMVLLIPALGVAIPFFLSMTSMHVGTGSTVPAVSWRLRPGQSISRSAHCCFCSILLCTRRTGADFRRG